MSRQRVMIIEKDKSICDYYMQVLNEQVDLEAAGCYHTGYEGLLEAVLDTPHILLIDEDIDGPQTGMLLAKALLRRFRDIKIILLTQNEKKQLMLSAAKAGIVDYLLKNDSKDIIVQTILEVDRLGHPRQTEITERFYKRNLHPGGVQDSLMYTLTVVSQLSPKELEITKLIGDGKSYEEIAALRRISSGDLLEIVERILDKFNKENRSELERMLRILNITDFFDHVI